MDIVFNCPRCSQHLSVEERGAGTLVNCPSCKEQIEIPRSTGSQPPKVPVSATVPPIPPPIPAIPPPIPPQERMNKPISEMSSGELSQLRDEVGTDEFKRLLSEGGLGGSWQIAGVVWWAISLGAVLLLSMLLGLCALM